MRWQLLIPLVGIVSGFFSLSVFWWAWQRRRERESYYRYELSRLMVERFSDDRDRLLEWLRGQDAEQWRQRREGFRLAAYILMLGGLGALVGLGFTSTDDSLFGWVPIGVGLALFTYLATTRSRDRDGGPASS